MRATITTCRDRGRAVAAGWLALAAALGGCGIEAETGATVVGPAPDVRAYDDASGTADDGVAWSEESDEEPSLETYHVALLDADGALVYVARPREASAGLDPYRMLVTLFEPITPDEEAAGFSSAVPVGAQVHDAYSVDPAGQHVNVYLSDEFDVGGTDLEIQRRVQQVACTVLVNTGAQDGDGHLELVELRIEGRSEDEARFVTYDELDACP